jgi:hypothetical protein
MSRSLEALLVADNQGDQVRVSIAERWVVYLMPVRHTAGRRAVCEQAEWDAMELARPGVNTLILGGIRNEGEAERLARGTSGAARPHNTRRALTSWPGEVAAVVDGTKGPVAG